TVALKNDFQEKIKAAFEKIVIVYHQINIFMNCPFLKKILLPHEKNLCQNIMMILFAQLINIIKINFSFQQKKKLTLKIACSFHFNQNIMLDTMGRKQK